MPQNRLSNLILFITPPLMWTGNILVARAIRGDVPPFTLSFARWLISLLLLLPFVWPVVRRQWPLYKKHKCLVAGTAFSGIAAFNTLVYTGLHSTTGTNALLLNSCIPVLIMLFGALWYRKPLNLPQSAGLLLSLAGVAVIVLQGSWRNLAALNFNSGDLWVFAAVVCWALYTMWTRKMPSEIDRTALTAVQIIIAMTVLAPLMLWEQSHGAHIIWRWQSIAGLAFVGIFPSVLAYLCYNAVIARFGAVRAGLSIHLMPVFGSFLAVTLLGETFHLYHLAGISAIFAGIFLSSRKAV